MVSAELGNMAYVTQTTACMISGRTFSPAKAAEVTGLHFQTACEAGHECQIGRFKGKPQPYGAGTLISEGGSSIETMLGQLELHIENPRRCGATDFDLRLTICYESQCNLELSSEELSRLATLGMPLSISCYAKDHKTKNHHIISKGEY